MTSFRITLAGLWRGLALSALVTAALPVAAQPQQPPGGQPPSPPPEAYKACEGKTDGTAVTLTMPDGKTFPGTCRTINGTLVAQPAGGPPGAGGSSASR